MKRIITLSLLVLQATLFFSSCEKIRQRTAKGQIIDVSTKEPVKNTSFTLFVTTYAQGFSGSDQIDKYSFATNETGNFTVLFEAKSNNSIGIGYPDAAPLSAGDAYFWSYGIGKKELEVNAGIIEIDKR